MGTCDRYKDVAPPRLIHRVSGTQIGKSKEGHELLKCDNRAPLLSAGKRAPYCAIPPSCQSDEEGMF